MSEPDELGRLRAHVDDLENRLRQYHNEFEYVAAERDAFAIDAARGGVAVIWGLVALVECFVITEKWLRSHGWLFGIVIWLAGLLITVVVNWQLEKIRLKDRAKMRSFPRWQSKGR
jgi:hypothetical protein